MCNKIALGQAVLIKIVALLFGEMHTILLYTRERDDIGAFVVFFIYMLR